MPLEWFTRKTPRRGNPSMSFSKIGQIHFKQSTARIMLKVTRQRVTAGDNANFYFEAATGRANFSFVT